MNVPHPLRISRDPHGERGDSAQEARREEGRQKKMDDDDEKSLSGLLTED